MKEVKSNLRWPGGKSKMTKILDNFFPEKVTKYLETFTGGGSVLLHIIQKYHPEVTYANDIDSCLINYYKGIQSNPQQVISECLEVKDNHNRESFASEYRLLDNNIASNFFISNKASFSGLSKNYSPQAYDKNFTYSCINRISEISEVIKGVSFINSDFALLDNVIDNIEGFFIYLDPPYFGNKDKGLYGDKGELHKGFNHLELFDWVNKHRHNNHIMISYDDSPYIRDLYKDYNIYSFDFVYSMTNTGGHLCKRGQEIVITNYKVDING